MAATRAAIEKTGRLFMYARLDLRAAVTRPLEILKGHERQDPVHEGRGEPSGSHCPPTRAMGDDRRRLADPDGMPSAFGGALSQSRSRQRHAARRSASRA
jgi:hypothetical protein